MLKRFFTYFKRIHCHFVGHDWVPLKRRQVTIRGNDHMETTQLCIHCGKIEVTGSVPTFEIETGVEKKPLREMIKCQKY